MLDPTSGVCVAVGSGPFPLSGACVRCGCGILELMGWFRVGPASSGYSPLYGLVQGGAIYRSMKVRDDGVVVAAMLRLLKVRSANQKTISLKFSGRTSNCGAAPFSVFTTIGLFFFLMDCWDAGDARMLMLTLLVAWPSRREDRGGGTPCHMTKVSLFSRGGTIGFSPPGGGLSNAEPYRCVNGVNGRASYLRCLRSTMNAALAAERTKLFLRCFLRIM